MNKVSESTGCQTKIAEKIVEVGADYVLAVKVSQYESNEKGHGRKEHRSYYVCDVPDDLADRARWKGLKQIGVAIRETI